MAITDVRKKKLRRATIIYWTLLIYIIAALVWWFISLERQITDMRDLRIADLRSSVDSTLNPAIFQDRLSTIHADHSRESTKYIGEGCIFLLLILVGAAFVYQSVRKQFFIHRQQQNFMMAVTHELKTPIAVVRLNLETMQKYNLDAEKQKKMFSVTLKEISRLNFLTNNILIASQLEGGGYKFSREELDLSDLLKDCINDFRARFPEKVFRTEIQDDVDILGDALLLQMLINNLLENAVKYAPSETPILATLRKFRDEVRMEVIDEGQGIEEAEKKKIFQKFYRMGSEATRKTQGTGLGLYLCSKIARDHNADIVVTNNIPRGSIFTVRFLI